MKSELDLLETVIFVSLGQLTMIIARDKNYSIKL